MKCPACSNRLQEMTVAGVTVDICKDGCGGIWFDNFEMKKFDEPHEPACLALLDTERDEGSGQSFMPNICSLRSR